MVGVVSVVATVLLGFAIAYWQFPAITRRWFERISMARRILWAVMLLAFAFVALTAGTIGYALAGAVILGYAGLYVSYEEPLDPIREYLEW